MTKTKYEKQAHELIQSIGDITVKSLIANDNVVSNNGIEKLTEIAVGFLDLKHTNEKKYKVEEAPFMRKLANNQYITYIASEFDRIYHNAIKQQNRDITINIIYNLYKILDKSLSYDDNWFVIEKLFETRNYFGSLYWGLLDYTIRDGTQREKNILIQHLVDIPHHAVMEWKYKADYVNVFITYHIFRMTKLIIDSKDFTTFKNEIDQWSSTLYFKEPSEFARRSASSLFPFYFNIIRDKDINSKSSKLRFLLEHECARDFNKIIDYHKELEEYRQLIIQKNPPQEQIDAINQKFIEFGNNVNQLFISSKIYGVFFRIGAYLIFKGEDYVNYLSELWYHTQPLGEQGMQMVNETPVSDDVTWNVLYTLYKGFGSRLEEDLDPFDDFHTASSYLYQYAVLLMLKLGKSFDIPTKDQIARWKREGENYQLDYYYDLLHSFPVQRFLDALEVISKSKKLLSIIRLGPEEKIEDRIGKIKESFEGFEKKKQEFIDQIVAIKPISAQKIEKFQQRISGAYDEYSISNKLANISYDENLIDPNLLTIVGDFSTDREFFVENNFSSGDVIFGPEVRLSLPEEKKILSFITNSDIETINENTTDFFKQINSGIQKLKQRKFNPDVIFMPLDVESKLCEKNWQLRTEKGLLIDGIEYKIIHSWNAFPFDEIIILDSNYLPITYKAKNQAERVKFEISKLDEGEPIVGVIAKLVFSIKITDREAFLKIINDEVKKLK